MWSERVRIGHMKDPYHPCCVLFSSFNVMLLSQIFGDYYKVKIISVVVFEFVNGGL